MDHRKKHQKTKIAPSIFSDFDHPRNKAKWQWTWNILPGRPGPCRHTPANAEMFCSQMRCFESEVNWRSGWWYPESNAEFGRPGPARLGRSTVRPGLECSAPARDGPGFPRDGLTCSSVLVLTLDRLRRVSNECCLCSTGG